MRILIVTEHFWPEAFRVNDLAAALSERHHNVEVLTALPNYPGGHFYEGYGLRRGYRESWRGVSIHRVPVVPRGRGQPWRLVCNYLSFIVAAAVVLMFRRSRWDVVFVFQPTPVTTIAAALPLRWRGLPLIAWIQDLWPETLRSTGIVHSRVALRAVGALSRWLYRQCDHVFVQSRAYEQPLASAGIESERMSYLPNWAEEVYLREPATSDKSYAWQRGFSVMFAGNLGRVQALETVLAAAQHTRHANVHWVFIGDGARREWLSQEVSRRQLGGHVHLLGRRPVEEMPMWFHTADALLVTLNRDDVLAMTIPSKVQSYLAAAVPIIGSLDGEGARVIAESGAGYVSGAEESAALASNVEKMSQLTRDARWRMGVLGRAYYDAHFARATAVSRIEEILASFASTAEAINCLGDRR